MSSLSQGQEGAGGGNSFKDLIKGLTEQNTKPPEKAKKIIDLRGSENLIPITQEKETDDSTPNAETDAEPNASGTSLDEIATETIDEPIEQEIPHEPILAPKVIDELPTPQKTGLVFFDHLKKLVSYEDESTPLRFTTIIEGYNIGICLAIFGPDKAELSRYLRTKFSESPSSDALQAIESTINFLNRTWVPKELHQGFSRVLPQPKITFEAEPNNPYVITFEAECPGADQLHVMAEIPMRFELNNDGVGTGKIYISPKQSRNLWHYSLNRDERKRSERSTVTLPDIERPFASAPHFAIIGITSGDRAYDGVIQSTYRRDALDDLSKSDPSTLQRFRSFPLTAYQRQLLELAINQRAFTKYE